MKGSPYLFMRYLLIIFLSIFSLGTMAQKAPPWVDYATRMSKYPDQLYLVGLATEINVEKYQASTTFDRLNQIARNQIIEAIHVSIKAESEMNISVENTKTDELFEQSSQSASKAQLVGLKFENYYNKKKETAYSFSYVLIEDIIDYYNDIVRTNTDIITKDFSGISSSNDKNTALKLLYDTQLKLREIDQATVILVAMKQTNSVDFGGITGMKKQVEDYANQILGNAPVTIDNIAKYFSYSLIPQTEEGSTAAVCISLFSYKDSGAESDFSETLKSSIYNTIGSESTLSSVESDSEACNYLLSGTYQESDNELIVSVSLVDKKNGNAVASKERTFSKSVLSLDGLRLLPANFEWIKDIPNIALVGNGEEFVLQTDEYIDKPISFKVEMSSQAQIDLPVKLVFNKDGSLAFNATVISEKDGTAQYFLNKENVPRSSEYELNAFLDVAALLSLDEKSDFYQALIRDFPPQVRKIQLKVLAPTVYVKSTEFNLGNEMNIQLLAPAIKNALVDLDYKFVDAEQNADYVLTIDAKTRQGQKNQYMYLSYLDATIAMYKNSTKKEIYKKGLSSVKGGAADYELAGVKAYEKAISSFLTDFISELKAN